ncbi:MAG TPA: methyltransferase [Aquihabitans sp.]|nr:methyltransferase [Aquihabitans sp.]
MPPTQPDRGDHYFSAEPSGASARRRVELLLAEGRVVALTTDRGVFSADAVDDGTRVLLASAAPDPGAAVLADVGCGYGAIAVALALRAPEARVWAIDVNERARALCRENADANGVGDRVEVVAPADVPAELVIDEVWSNPPIRIGKAALHDLLSGWLDRLRPGSGRAVLVVQKHLGADSLARWIEASGRPTERIASRAGYRVLRVSTGPGCAPAPGPPDEASS